MKRIDFFLIGAQKAGTSTLYDWLGQHSKIDTAPFKEVVYFVEDHIYAHGEGYLRRCFKDADPANTWGMAYVHMMQSAIARERLYDYNPKAKIIAVLRNPIDRAYSAYWFAKRSGWENCATFEDAIRLEAIRAKGTHTERQELQYLANGHYADFLEPWIEKFGRENLHVVLTEDIKKRPVEALAGTLEFLGIPGVTASQVDVTRKKNESAWPRYPLLQKVILSYDGWYKRIGRAAIPVGMRYHLWQHVLYPLSRWNLEPFEYPKLAPATRERLAAEFAPKNARLGELIGRDLSHWK